MSTDGYFDVYRHPPRTNGDKPAYRTAWPNSAGHAAPTTGSASAGSLALAEAVTAWSAVNGAAALDGSLGGGRDGNQEAA
jgi:hypothetical protein